MRNSSPFFDTPKSESFPLISFEVSFSMPVISFSPRRIFTFSKFVIRLLTTLTVFCVVFPTASVAVTVILFFIRDASIAAVILKLPSFESASHPDGIFSPITVSFTSTFNFASASVLPVTVTLSSAATEPAVGLFRTRTGAMSSILNVTVLLKPSPTALVPSRRRMCSCVSSLSSEITKALSSEANIPKPFPPSCATSYEVLSRYHVPFTGISLANDITTFFVLTVGAVTHCPATVPTGSSTAVLPSPSVIVAVISGVFGSFTKMAFEKASSDITPATVFPSESFI